MTKTFTITLAAALTLSGAAIAQDYEDTAPTVYVVRNGPTVRKRDAAFNTSSGPLKNG